jgi:hypothetical protein
MPPISKYTYHLAAIFWQGKEVCADLEQVLSAIRCSA